jgi:hypothetical protein
MGDQGGEREFARTPLSLLPPYAGKTRAPLVNVFAHTPTLNNKLGNAQNLPDAMSPRSPLIVLLKKDSYFCFSSQNYEFAKNSTKYTKQATSL